MSARDGEGGRGRILVALDAAEASPASLEAVAELAVRLRAGVEALLVEDEELLRLVDFPHVHELVLATGRAEAIDRRRLELQLRGVAEEMRQALGALGRRLRIPTSLRVVRGSMVGSLPESSAGVDLVVLQARARPWNAPAASEAALEAVLARLDGPVLLLPREPRAPGTAVALVAGLDDLDGVLSTAARFGDERAPIVISFAPPPDARAAVRDATRAWLAAHEQDAFIYRLAWRSPFELGQSLQRAGAGLLVMTAAALPHLGVRPGHLVEALGVPILILPVPGRDEPAAD